MRKVFKLQDLDCANCAAKMERAIAKLEVEEVSVNFISQRMTIVAEEERFEAIMDEVVKVCKRVEPDCRILRA